MRHPVVGDLELTYEMMDIAADADLSIVTYTAEPDTASTESKVSVQVSVERMRKRSAVDATASGPFRRKGKSSARRRDQ